MAKKTVLIAGASGLVGAACVDKFLEEGDTVIALSRRRPEIFSKKEFTHLALDLQDAAACKAAADQFKDVTHIVYTAVFELPGLIPGWSEKKQMDTNLAMLQNLMEPLQGVAKGLKHVSLLQGTKAYGVHLHPIRIPARERHPRDQHENFYWLQEDYIKEQSKKNGWNFTIWRPQLIVGPNYGVVMNLPPVIGAYAAIRKKEGKPFSYTGGIRWVWEAVDTRVVADAIHWGSDAATAVGQHFNITNGEVFDWRDMWPAMAEVLGVEVGPDEPQVMSEYLLERSHIWDEIVKEHGLRPLSIEELCGESHYYAALCMTEGATEPLDPAFVSTVKLRNAGFNGAMDTEESFCYWLKVLQDRKVIPAAK